MISRRDFLKIAGVGTASAAAALALAACKEKTGGTTGGQRDIDDGTGYKIGMIMTNLDNAIYVQLKDDAEQYCKAHGATFQFTTGPDAAAIVTAIENMANAGCDAIIFTATQGDAIKDAVNAAADRGVKMFAFDGEYDVCVRCYQGTNMDAGLACGRMVGDWITSVYGDEKVEVLMLSTESLSGIELGDRHVGMIDGLAEAAPNAVIAAISGVEALGSAAKGMEYTESMLQAHPDAVAVMGFNGTCTCGAYQAFATTGRDDDLHGVFGVDGAPEELKYIASDCCFRGTIGMGFATLGSQMASEVIQTLNGKEWEEQKSKWPVEVITMENIADYEDYYTKFA